MFRVFSIVLLLVCAAPALASELDSILARNAKAHGDSAYARIDAIKVQLHITEPTFEVTGTYVATRSGQMRIDIYVGEDRVFAEGLNADCAWEWNPGQSEEELGACVGETETAALRHGIELPGNFFTMQEVRERGADVELIGDTESEWQVRVTLADGFARDYFIDQESFRINRARDFRAFHPGIDPTRVNIETRYEDQKFVDGVLRVSRQVNVNVDTDEVLGTTRILSVEHNPQVSDEMFEAGWVPVVARH